MLGNRYALVLNSEPEEVAPYLPSNYTVVGRVLERGHFGTIIAGSDSAGWTLEDYVLPRLASGLRHGVELVSS